ncbi:hypothetical protein N7541_000697 [Penicillium brevicompactum]|uniref:Uncharacterized protein n=1 Tax=Penicillium brevicompactum TaxID=5074 RepID=A0A9W9RV72_PENBR|nr:hypothetical protein N7541_000697 [Penicillium brevicompactum]
MRLALRSLSRRLKLVKENSYLMTGQDMYTGKRLDERVSSSAANVESTLIKVVGTIAQQECSSCLKGNGPLCAFPDITNTVTACGNCQWNSQKSRCDFYQASPGGRATSGHRRNRSSASSGGSPQVNLVVESERATVCKAALEEIQEAIRRLQARHNIDLMQLAAMRNVLAQGVHPPPHTIPAIQAFMPTMTPEENRAEFDRILAMLERVKLAL